MNIVKVRCGHAKAGITRALSFALTIDDSTSIDLLEIHMTRLTDAWSNFTTHQDSLYEFCDDEAFVDPEEEFAEYEDKYCQAYALIQNSIRNLSKSSSITDQSLGDTLASQQASILKKLDANQVNPKTVKLPECKIPTFYGDYKDWPGFRDLFTGTIDRNTSITATQKFQYLKSFLGGDAANLIKHISCSENNYLEAWDKLEARFDKKHLIIQSFIQSFISLQSCSSNNVQSLRKLTDGADETIRGLKALGSESRDPWLIFILLQKVDHETKQAWAEEIGSNDECTISKFLEFLENRCSCLESCYTLPVTRSSKTTNKAQSSVRTHLVETKIGCPKCQEDHLLPSCKAFMGLSVDARRKFVKEKSLCFNCLRSGHPSNKCHSNFRCKMCSTRHHTLVHPIQNANTSHSNTSSNQDEKQSPPSSSPRQDTNDPIVINHSLEANHHTSTILPTAVVRTRDKQGVYQNIRVLLDTGSQVSFVTEQCVQRLGLSRKRIRIPILGVASTSAGVTNGLVNLTIHSTHDSNNIDIDCYVITKLTSLLPSTEITNIDFTKIFSMNLADPAFNIPGPIDILIGSDKVFSIINGPSEAIVTGGPKSIPTIFGWVIAGSYQQQDSRDKAVRSFCTRLDYSQHVDLERFFRLEEVNYEPFLSVEEQQAEEHFASTHRRHEDGKYMVELPFKNNVILNEEGSLRLALNRLFSIERRFLSDPNLKTSYSKFIEEYISLGHMEEIPPNELQKSTPHYYLPHHPVIKEDSTTTKVRVVFDGSAKLNHSGTSSLNESLLVGPTIQRDIFSICLRSRRHSYTITGDIEKMYRQIWISPKHTNFQRIIWRDNPEDPIKHFKLLTVTYGTSAAPFLAVRTLKQLALDVAESNPRVSSIILNDFYVDDIITGADCVDELISLQKELVDVLHSAGFNLRKWTTNCWPLLLSLPEDQRQMSPIEFEDSNMVKVLGLQWCPSKDSFTYKVKFPNKLNCTKRGILSDASRIFDPLGFVAPVIIAIKIFFQDLWREKLGWDDQVPEEMALRWTTIRDQLHLIESISVPRIIWTNKINCELHAFCDASLDAYGAVVYCRSISLSGGISVSLVASKTRVAPIKILSLPRLELCGALLLTHLINKIKLSLQADDLRVFAWTDSAIVLHWLSATPKKWSVFIGNRTSEILSSIPRKAWNHVRSECNPADVASRGISPQTLTSFSMWWNGPAWLSKESSEWPLSQYGIQDICADQLEERKSNNVQVFVSNIKYKIRDKILQEIIAKSSNWIKSVRVLAYIFRFIRNYLHLPKANDCNYLTTEEIAESKTRLIKCAQNSTFSSEIEILNNFKELPSRSKLISLSPFLDQNNVLRVGGRLSYSDLSFNEKHPIILCKSHRVTKLIVEYTHTHYLHAGVSLMFTILKQNYHIIGCRNLLRKTIHDCVKCFRQRKTSSTQFMSDLPVERVRFSRPFSKVGCDYAGPITLRLAHGPNPKFIKAYIAIFVCFVTRGIHIELVGDLSSNAFLLALDRFVSRRGKPSEIWSDNATNFHGAKRILGELYNLLLSEQHHNIIIDHLSKDHITWKFIPPSAPHFGGLWEAGVKSVKNHLKRVIGENRLTYEEMYTLLAKIECLLNSRPMWQTSDYEPTALSPSHFMIGESYSAIPQPDLINLNISKQTNWYLLQTLMQGFWKRWHHEYLTSLQNRPKWKKFQPNLQIDDIILLKEPNLPPSKWILGRIINTHPGEDDRCRVVTVRTQFGNYTRPIVKIAPLPKTERPESSRGG
ncbi:uncharacterized protein LOC129912570 [Episyrphus balteatus]|uniref:uncharacterized protein LOC129912570 n=1 Tax=Episyrphus balteatus TaxID=286459 RepID=UPI0024862397|nr:uncharacterized protein LOC129912570 [Episyrphus balteatus]